MKYTLVFYVLLALLGQTNSLAVEVHGHRGARAIYPENTMIAFRYALASGVDTLEFDVVLSKDNIPIVVHDEYVNSKICQASFVDDYDEDLGDDGEKIYYSDLSLRVIKKIDCGSKKNPKFDQQITSPGEKIPTLREVLKLVQDHNKENRAQVKLNLEAKTSSKNNFYLRHFAKTILKDVNEFKLLASLTYQSFNLKALSHMKKLSPSVQISVLTKKRSKHFLSLCKQVKCDIISPRYKKVNKKIVAKLAAHGIKVIPWTPNKSKNWKKLIQMNVHAIITDDPKSLILYLNKLGLR